MADPLNRALDLEPLRHPDGIRCAHLDRIRVSSGAARGATDWVEALPGKPVFVAYAAGFDLLFVYGYLMRFVGRSPFGFSALDMKSFAMAVLRQDYRASTRKTMARAWFDPLPHSHVALDDAIEQGALFCNMLQANRAG